MAHDPASFARFDTTSWSLVLAAADAAQPEADHALAQLCQAYWRPLYAFLRRRGTSSHDAKDLVQGFFLHLLESRPLQRADPRRGRFRSYLIGALKHFVADEHARRTAAKRGGPIPALSLDDAHAEALIQEPACAGLTAEQLYERQWALEVIELALARLEAEQTRRGRAALYRALKPCLTGELDAPRYEAIALDLGTTVNNVKVTAHRLRKDFQVELRREIARTVDNPAEIAGELALLRAALVT